MKVSLGLGLTNACNLACPHCYRPDPPEVFLPFETVRAVCESLDVGGVNLGTGENVLHPEFRKILDYLLARGLRVSLTSNGLGIAELPADVLRRLHDVEVSIDFADAERFDAFRGTGAWSLATGGLTRCRELGVPTTVLAVLMRENHRDLPALARVAAGFDAPLRVNLYQPVKSTEFLPTYAELWSAVEDLLRNTTLLGCSEPVIRAAAGLPGEGLRCGRTSLRITPLGELLPCVYWPISAGRADAVPERRERLFDLPDFRGLGHTPPACRDCELLPACGGGCAARRMLLGGLDEIDPYCPKKGDVDLRGLPRLGEAGARLHIGNVCTLLVRS